MNNIDSDSFQQSSPGGPHLWEIRAVREGFFIIAIGVALWCLWYLRPIVAPLLVAFTLAYAVDPVITTVHRRLGVPRVGVAVAVLFMCVALGLALGAWALPHVVDQAGELLERIPSYLDTVSNRYGIQADRLRDQLASKVTANPQDSIQRFAAGSAHLFGFVGSVVGTTTYLAVASVLVVVMFVYLSARFDHLAEVKRLIPPANREMFSKLIQGVDEAFSGYIRGQLVVAVFTSIGFCVGFWLVDVPYWFVVSLIGGVLSLIPYGQCSGWLLAITLKYLETVSAQGDVSFSFTSVFLLPTVVYGITQSSETWLITPLVQGQATRLHPVTIILALLIGGFAAGILGLVLAIPVTASLKFAYREIAGPRLSADVPRGRGDGSA
ncbi:MAG: AI-2E family transporter [Phycisphaerae bacterium]|jgi:predicted PurR-regulated permease PerM